MRSKIKPFFYKILLFVIPVVAFFEILFRMGFYPIITNSTLFDLKMMAAQKHHLKSVKVMSIGASVALYQLNSKLIVQNLTPSYYNFASWGLQISDTRAMLSSYVKRYQPKYVILCSSLRDFTTAPNPTYLDYLNAGELVKDSFPELFYLEDFHSIHQIVRRKVNQFSLKFDDWGGAPLSVKRDANMPADRDVFPTEYTTAEYKQLDTLSAFLKSQNVKLIFIQVPIRKSFSTADTLKQVIQAHFDKCKNIVEANGGVYLNYHNPEVFTDNLFLDNYHLLDAGSVIFTKELIADVKKIIH